MRAGETPALGRRAPQQLAQPLPGAAGALGAHRGPLPRDAPARLWAHRVSTGSWVLGRALSLSARTTTYASGCCLPRASSGSSSGPARCGNAQGVGKLVGVALVAPAPPGQPGVSSYLPRIYRAVILL